MARAVLIGDARSSPWVRRRSSRHTAKQDLPAGATLDGLGGHDTQGVADRVDVTRAEHGLPMGVAQGCVLSRDLAKEAVLARRTTGGRLVNQLGQERSQLGTSG